MTSEEQAKAIVRKLAVLPSRFHPTSEIERLRKLAREWVAANPAQPVKESHE